MHQIDIADQQTRLTIDEAPLRAAARRILTSAGIEHATISIALVDDPTIHALNREYLQHDYPTDVISFVLESSPGALDGEVIASTDTAVTQAARIGWPAEHELLLYVVHGLLHLVGHDDQDPESLARMRAAERETLAAQGITARYDA